MKKIKELKLPGKYIEVTDKEAEQFDGGDPVTVTCAIIMGLSAVYFTGQVIRGGIYKQMAQDIKDGVKYAVNYFRKKEPNGNSGTESE